MSDLLGVDFVEQMEEVNILYRKLDELAINILKTLQSIMSERKYLDANLQEGYINMAKARYLMRGQKVGIHQVNSANLTATFRISSYLGVDEGLEYLNYKLDEDSGPQKDVNLKFRSVNAGNQLIDCQSPASAVAEVNCETEGSGTLKDSICSNSNDPLKWFGVLVPESLRTCQSRFKQSALTALKIASLHNKLKELQKNYKTLKLQKASLQSHIDSKDVYNISESKCNLVKS